MTPFSPETARQAAADLAYPDDRHGQRVGTQWPETTPVQIRGVNPAHVDMSWQNDTAACIGHPVDWWFPADKTNATTAKEICQTCPLINPCKAHGIAHELHGVWGGTTPKERRKLRGQTSRVQTIAHGTRAGYDSHRRNPEAHGPVCDPCRRAYNAVEKGRRMRQRQARIRGVVEGDGTA